MKLAKWILGYFLAVIAFGFWILFTGADWSVGDAFLFGLLYVGVKLGAIVVMLSTVFIGLVIGQTAINASEVKRGPVHV